MNHRLIIISLATVITSGTYLARIDQPPADSRPSSLNIVGQQYPRIDSQRRAIFRIYAPEAQSVRVDLGGGTELTKGDDGYWTGTTRSLDIGFHYYQLIIDGVAVADPATESFFGVGNVRSGIEVPSPGEDFYDIKNVPHGEIRSRYYYVEATGETRHAYIYTPPGYDKDTNVRYPVLYLQHGMGEDRRAWSTQGRTNFILDNLIAEGKAKPMIVVMEDGGIAGGFKTGHGGTRRRVTGARNEANTDQAPNTETQKQEQGSTGQRSGPARSGGFWDAFGSVLIEDIIPMVDSTYRTIPDRKHRAMAGLSLGGTQTYQITQNNLDKFAYIGIFSAPFGFPGVETGYNGLLAKPDEFAKQVKVFYISMGSKERASTGRSVHKQLERAGVKHVYYESPETAHEFQTWRRSLYGFAQLIFQD